MKTRSDSSFAELIYKELKIWLKSRKRIYLFCFQRKSVLNLIRIARFALDVFNRFLDALQNLFGFFLVVFSILKEFYKKTNVEQVRVVKLLS